MLGLFRAVALLMVLYIGLGYVGITLQHKLEGQTNQPLEIGQVLEKLFPVL